MTEAVPAVVPFEDRNIVLTGFMGTGKSTVGRRLAKVLGFAWVDTDRLIEERHGSIPEIFGRAGETVFRGIERNIATELAPRTQHVFSTGGRMLLDPDNIRTFSAAGRIFCLTVEPDILVTRLLESPTRRPLLAGPNPEASIRTLLAARQAGYARFTQVPSGTAPADDVTAKLAEMVNTPTSTPNGRRGYAVLGDAVTDLPRPIVVVSDERLAELYSPCLGPVDRVVTGIDTVDEAASVILLGGTSVTSRADAFSGIPRVLAPTSPRAMDLRSGIRTIADLATLQTHPEPAG